MEGNEIEEPKVTSIKSMPLSTRNLYGSAQKNKIKFSNEEEEENGPRLKRSNSEEHFNFDDEFEEKDQ